MRCRIPILTALLGLALIVTGCGSSGSSGGSAAGTAASSSDGDAGVLAHLQTSETWTAPRCRWLEHGTWILADRQDTALYRAAADLGYISIEQVGEGNRIGVPEPAWRITLTDAGKAEAARCPPSSKPSVWGVPVSQRRFLSGKYVGKDYGQRSLFEVEFEWVPTAVGEQVKQVLTDHMKVEEGKSMARVYMTSSGQKRWWEINDLPTNRR
jgi:hypothetical protein